MDTSIFLTNLKLIGLILLNFIEGLIAGFISIIASAGWMLYYYGEWNKFSISFCCGAVIGFLLFLTVLAGIPLYALF